MVFERLLGRKRAPEKPAGEREVTEAQVERDLQELAQAKEAPVREKVELRREKLSEALSEYTGQEIEDIIVQLSNSGTRKSEIGIILRDQYGIPSVKQVTGKTITDILRDKNVEEEIPEAVMDLIKKSVNLLNHMEKNRKDFSAKRGYQLTVSKINKLAKYYKEKKRLPADWHYTEERARLLVK